MTKAPTIRETEVVSLSQPVNSLDHLVHRNNYVAVVVTEVRGVAICYKFVKVSGSVKFLVVEVNVFDIRIVSNVFKLLCLYLSKDYVRYIMFI